MPGAVPPQQPGHVWRIRVFCPNGHAYEVPIVCETCDTPREPQERELTRREKRAVKKAIERLEKLDG